MILHDSPYKNKVALPQPKTLATFIADGQLHSEVLHCTIFTAANRMAIAARKFDTFELKRLEAVSNG